MVPLSIATAVATKAHHGQSRADGSSYIEHPLAVSRILMEASTHLPSAAYAAAVLHDVLEDSDISYSDLAERVGRTVASAVLALTRPPRNPEESFLAAEQRYLSQLRTGNALQPYILLVKMADRIHNLETALALPRARREVLIAATAALYVPFLTVLRPAQPKEFLAAYDTLLDRLQKVVARHEKRHA